MDVSHGIVMLLCILMLEITLTIQDSIDVTKFGAVGDGKSDDTQAFIKAWNAVCKDKGSKGTMVVPASKSFLVQSVEFAGPCLLSPIFVQIEGQLIAPKQNEFKNKEKWISFYQVIGLVIYGNGGFDGMATTADWWKGGDNRPNMVGINDCSKVIIRDLRFQRPPRSHISISDSNDVTIQNVQIKAPGNSPNTDGIDITRSSNVKIHHCTIQTGDDCIAISSGSSNINITNINCGPGHGISIGSLGRDGSNGNVENVHVESCTFTGTENAARIKTSNLGSGFARYISFKDITLVDSKNPIIIDQNYCPGEVCKDRLSNIKLSDLTFTGFKGTSANKEAVTLNCSPKTPCENIQINDINLKPSANLKEPLTTICTNAHGRWPCPTCNPPINCVTNV